MLYTNIIHRIDPDPVRLEALGFQWECAQKLGIRTTSLLTWQSLRSDTAVKLAEETSRKTDDELGLHFHEFACKAFQEKYHSNEKAFWLLPRSVRTGMIDEMMEAFYDRFGKHPTSVGCYILDAWTLRYIKDHYPTVKIAITNCFEEGVKMFQGSYYTWNLFSDGGPWGPFWPHQKNAMIPAPSKDEAIDLVAVPHLNRDMIMSIISRDDLFASHPLNLVRAKINDGADCPYMYRFYDQWVQQSAFNSVNYLSYFVSSPWLSKDNFLLGDSKDGRVLYRNSLEYLKQAQEDGKLQLVTMSEFADVFNQSVPVGSATACDWKDVLTESKRQMTWVVNSHYRAAFDLNVGGALCDFRVYSGRLERNIGPDKGAQHLWNGNYPYVISAEHRGGIDKSGWTCRLDYEGQTAWLHKRRINGKLEKHEAEGRWKLTCDPVRLTLGTLKVSIQSVFNFDDSGEIQVERILTESSDPNATIQITEVFTGTIGTTEYPDSLDGSILWMKQTTGSELETLDFGYLSRELVGESVSVCGVDLPLIGSRISLQPMGDHPASGKVVEGFGFFPAFQLQLSKSITLQETSKSCLILNPLNGH